MHPKSYAALKIKKLGEDPWYKSKDFIIENVPYDLSHSSSKRIEVRLQPEEDENMPHTVAYYNVRFSSNYPVSLAKLVNATVKNELGDYPKDPQKIEEVVRREFQKLFDFLGQYKLEDIN